MGLLHPHVHGPVPLIPVGLPVAQVGVGAVRELNVGLHEPLIIPTHADPSHVYHPLQVNPHVATGAIAQLVVGVHVDPFHV